MYRFAHWMERPKDYSRGRCTFAFGSPSFNKDLEENSARIFPNSVFSSAPFDREEN